MRIRVTDQSSTGKATSTFVLDDIPSAITLRDLIRTRVRDEVARYNSDPGEVFEGLVMPDGAAPGSAGFVMGSRRRVDWKTQADEAISSFERNGFFVLVDDLQVTDLDADLNLTADGDIRFVRLVQLVGG